MSWPSQRPLLTRVNTHYSRDDITLWYMETLPVLPNPVWRASNRHRWFLLHKSPARQGLMFLVMYDLNKPLTKQPGFFFRQHLHYFDIVRSTEQSFYGWHTKVAQTDLTILICANAQKYMVIEMSSECVLYIQTCTPNGLRSQRSLPSSLWYK